MGRFGPIDLAFGPNMQILAHMRCIQYTIEAPSDVQVTVMFFLSSHSSPMYPNLNIRERYNSPCCGSII